VSERASEWEVFTTTSSSSSSSPSRELGKRTFFGRRREQTLPILLWAAEQHRFAGYMRKRDDQDDNRVHLVAAVVVGGIRTRVG
jgi:hypothetical protein